MFDIDGYVCLCIDFFYLCRVKKNIVQFGGDLDYVVFGGVFVGVLSIVWYFIVYGGCD